MNPLISIIVPVYKVEKYLSKCISSILLQEYDHLEILLVNDGSPDRCGTICNRFAEKDQRIKVIHKENGGLSDARNAGLRAMTGDYVTFVDSDDTIEENYISTLVNLAERHQTQIAVTLFRHIKEGEEKILVEKSEKLEKLLSINDALETMFYQDLFDNNATGKLYHNSLFKNIEFPKGLLYEDLLTTYKLILLSHNGVSFSDLRNYNYLLRDDSIEGSPFNKKKFDSLIYILKDLKEFKSETPSLHKCIDCRILSLLFHLFFETEEGSMYESEIFILIKKYRVGVLIDRNARKKARIASVISFLGRKPLRIFYKFGQSRN